jgi:putative intracellular protease/amidase
MPRVLIPIPSRDFDPTEVAVSWQVLSGFGSDVMFATPDGLPASGDELMLTGEGLDPWGFLPGVRRLVGVGRFLRADTRGRDAYQQLESSAEFRAPTRWEDAEVDSIDGLLLPGGHRARGMREYLESEILQRLVVEAFNRDLPIGAICHGVLLVARSIDPTTGRSILFGRKTTALTWSLEARAWRVTRITRFWDPNYYRTYRERPRQPAGYMSVEGEVTRALAQPQDFLDVEPGTPAFKLKTSGRARDTFHDESPAFVVQDGSYVSARWPGDTHTFARRLADVLKTPGRSARPRSVKL